MIRKIWFISLGAFLPFIARAQDNGIVPCGPENQFGKGNECKISDIFTLFVDIYNFLLATAGVVAFGFLIYGGVQMLLYSVDEEHLASGKRTVMQALIGLAIVALAYIVVNTLLSALGLNEGAGGFFDGTKFLGTK